MIFSVIDSHIEYVSLKKQIINLLYNFFIILSILSVKSTPKKTTQPFRGYANFTYTQRQLKIEYNLCIYGLHKNFFYSFIGAY